MTRATTPRPTAGSARSRRPAAKPAAAPAASAAVSATSTFPPVDALGDQWFVIPDLSWEKYVTVSNAIVERPGVRMIYNAGRLTLLTESRKHGWYGERFPFLVWRLAQELNMTWEDAGSATYRKEEKQGGVEGDKTYYFGEHAELMRGSKDIDLASQPPPDLAIEVEVSHSADDAVIVWGRLGVPEVWRFDPIAFECSFWKRRRNGTYGRIKHSLAFPMLTPDDVRDQMRLADELGAARWSVQLDNWIRTVIIPRTAGGNR